MVKQDNYFPSKILQDAVDAISSLPGVGSRSALRLALYLLKQPKENIHHFTNSIQKLADEVQFCSDCMMVCDNNRCDICSDNKRDHNTICVVESIRDVISIEQTKQYNGVYHILGGIISPINGVGPDDLNIKHLVQRVKPGNEIILALSGDVEGETTSFYIYRLLENFEIKISTLARGIGFGADLEYTDTLTLGRSILNRQLFKP